MQPEYCPDPKLEVAGFMKYTERNTKPHDTLCRPVVVSFEEDHAREEVLQKAGMLKGSKVYITEDLSRCEHDNLNFAMLLTDTCPDPHGTQGESWRGS